jgi:IMP dehydrogenase
MTSVAQILRSKSDCVVHKIEADVSVYDAVQLMAEKQIGSLLVMEGGEIAGIVTERDYARKIVLLNRESRTTVVREIMSTRVLFVQPEQAGNECMALMSEHHLRHLPVLDRGNIVGIISIGDLVKEIIADQRFIIEQLEHYVRS